jgi:nifR3 family TIM-barrel protein
VEKNFWKTLKKPFFVLAPMANVTDAAFRQVIAKYGKPDVFWTEFVSADGLISVGHDILKKDLIFGENEHPIVAQLFSSNPEKMEKASSLIQELGFDGLDINMGCPDRTIEKQGAGASLIKTKTLAKEIIRAAKRGAPHLPISVKTRSGYSKRELEEWIPALLEEGITALTVHARTRKEMSKVPAEWGDVKRAVEIRNNLKKDTLIIGNGDALDLSQARVKAEETGADGIMFGRAIFGNPWLFADLVHAERGNQTERPERSEGYIPLEEKLRVLVEHTKLFEKYFNGVKSFFVMKKHFKAYIKGFPGAKELHNELMETKNSKEVENTIERFLLNASRRV